MNNNMLQRHSLGAIIMHWFNAVLFIVLLLSGLAMLRNPELTVLGAWWSNFLDAWLGTALLLDSHIVLGFIWIVGVLIYTVLYRTKDVIPFMYEICRINLVSDLRWCVRKGLLLTLGEQNMRKYKLNPELPPQGFYNAGQKLAAISIVICSLVLAISGLVLYLHHVTPLGETLVQWTLLTHFAAAGIMLILLPIHIYMAALAPGEGPALRSMFTGTVPASFAKHHNPLWYADMTKKNTSQP